MRAPRTTLSQLGHPRVLVVGDVMLDRYTWGDAERVSPEAPVLVLRADECEVRLGGAASVARLLRGLEATVTLAGVIGDDASGRTVRRLLDEGQVDARRLLVDSARPTTTKERFLGRAANRHAHQILRVDTESRTPLDENLAARMACDVAAMLSDEASEMSEWPGQNEVMARSVETSGPSRWSDPATQRPSKLSGTALAAGCTDDARLDDDRRLAPRRSEVASSVAAVLISDYAKGVCTPELVSSVIAAAREVGVPVLVDPARGADYERYRGATLLKPNRLEAEMALGHGIASPTEALHAAQTLRERYDLTTVVITLDREGLVFATAEEAAHVPIAPRAVYDITGAGDMVLAMLGLSLASDLPLSTATELANLAAGLEVQQPGVTPVSRQDIGRELERLHRIDALFPLVASGGCQPTGSCSSAELNGVAGKTKDTIRLTPDARRTNDEPLPAKLVTLDEAARLAADYRSAGQTVVFTNGCFDLLHAGHVRCLEAAARHGDVLIVAINNDASVRRLKGPDRPIVGEHDRARMLSALECVDHVLIFDDPTPHRLLHVIRPDVLVKGGTTVDIVGREVVEAQGGKVLRTGAVPGLSTTTLVSRLQSRSLSPVLEE